MTGPEKTLVSHGAGNLLPEGNTVVDLQPGQLGVFDYNTGKSVDQNSTVTGKSKFFFAVGLDMDGDGVTDNIMTSAGEYHDMSKAKWYFTSQRDAVNMKILYKDYLGKSNTEYGLKVLVKSDEISVLNGHTNKYENFVFKTECKDCSGDCYDVDANKITLGLRDIINTSDYLQASAVARQAITAATHGTSQDYAVGAVVSDADIQALITYNETQTNNANKVYTDLLIEVLQDKPSYFSNIPYKYDEGWLVSSISKFGEGSCTGEIQVVQEPVFAVGTGNQVRMMEFASFGHVDTPYRQRVYGGDVDILLNASPNGRYDIFTIKEVRKTGETTGSGVHENILTTHIAVVKGSGTNLDTLLKKFSQPEVVD